MGMRNSDQELNVPHVGIMYGGYTETDLDGPDQDEPTDFSQKYKEHMDLATDFEAPRSLPENAKDTSFHDDSLKIYCTEGTPLNFSTATSLSDLSDLHLCVLDSKLGNKDLKAKAKITFAKPVHTTVMYVYDEDPHVKKLNVDHDGKPAHEAPEANSSLETPLMFSRCSSLGSLSSFDQQSIHDDRSSSISDFSRRASEALSLSDLPDSPGQTMPPSPHQPKLSSGELQFPLITTKTTVDSYLHLKAMVHGIHESIQGIEESSEDSLKLFAEENIPSNISESTNLSFLTVGDESKIEKEACISKVPSSPILEEQGDVEVKVYDKDDKEALHQFQNFSSVVNVQDLNSADKERDATNLVFEEEEEEDLGACRDSMLSENNESSGKNTTAPGKSVTFGQEVNYSLETPLVFSRCSSLGSLSSFDQQSIQEDGNSVVSDFSRRASEVVSPSDLPDSPSQTMPPSPHHSKHSSAVFTFTLSRSCGDRQLKLSSDEIHKKQEEYSDDCLKIFAVEDTPVNISSATSLSILTIEDEPKIESNLCAPVLCSLPKDKEDSVNTSLVEKVNDISSLETKDQEGNILHCNMDNLQTSNSADNTQEASDLDSEEEDILAACINAGMPLNNSLNRSNLSAHSRNSTFRDDHHNYLCQSSPESVNGFDHLSAHDISRSVDNSFSKITIAVHNCDQAGDSEEYCKSSPATHASNHLKVFGQKLHKSRQGIEESAEDSLLVFAEESTPCNISAATSLSFLTIEDELEIQNDVCMPSPPNFVEIENEKMDNFSKSVCNDVKKDRYGDFNNKINKAKHDATIQDRSVDNKEVASDLDSEEEDILAECISAGMQGNSSLISC